VGSKWNTYAYGAGSPPNSVDSFGLKDCKISIRVGHNYNVASEFDEMYDRRDDGNGWVIEEGECIIGVGCGSGEDVNGDGQLDSIQEYIEHFNPCNSVLAPELCKIDDPVQGLTPLAACNAANYAFKKAQEAALRMLGKRGKRSPNPAITDCEPECESVTIEIKCDEDMTRLSEDGIWNGNELPKRFRRGCAGICGKKQTIPR
jgi:hypothetical protein